MKRSLLIVLACIAAGGIAAGYIVHSRRVEDAQREAARQQLLRELDATPATQAPIAEAIPEVPAPDQPPRTGVRGYDISPATAPSVEPSAVASNSAQSTQLKPARNQNLSRKQAGAGRGALAQPAVDPNADKPIARQALALVGADPVAEQVWMNAINDPGTSAHDRQDLIEDLNEDGFDDPHNPTAAELPLIENRLALIEQIGPGAMDDVNAAAFAEAYKDLVNMHSRLVGQ